MKRKTTLTIQKDRFLINGKLIYSEYPRCSKEYYGRLMNARFIQGIFDDKSDVKRFERFGKSFNANKNTDDLIKALTEWYQKGLRAITVGFQGGGPCFTMDSTTIDNNAFSPDGMTIDIAYLTRMKRIIEAADNIGMVVIVSLFYGHQVRHLDDDRAVIEAVKTASNWLRDEGFSNVILEIANEQDLGAYLIHPILYNEKGIVQLLKMAKRESGGIPVGCSTTGKYFAYEIANESDVILIHGNNMTRQGFYNHIMEAKSVKPIRPIVCNEDSQALSQMGVALDMGISWGYYNNMTKQEPPIDWGITEGEDLFFTTRLAESLGIEENTILTEQQYYIQGLEKNAGYDNKRWIRLASVYPETIYKVEFYRNGKYFATAYDDPFTINFEFNWIQHAVEGVEAGEKWKAIITLVDGKVITKENTAE